MPMLIRLTSDSSSSSSCCDQLLVGDRHRRLRGQGFDEALVGAGKAADRAGLAVHRVDQLEHADQFALVVGHRHRQEGLRVVAEGLVEQAHAREVEDVGLVDVLDVHRLAEVGRVGRHRRQVLVAVAVVQRHRRQVDRLAAGAALVDVQRVVQRDVEAQAPAVRAGPVQVPPSAFVMLFATRRMRSSRNRCRDCFPTGR
jgi:hypothetical protein